MTLQEHKVIMLALYLHLQDVKECHVQCKILISLIVQFRFKALLTKILWPQIDVVQKETTWMQPLKLVKQLLQLGLQKDVSLRNQK